MKLGRSPSALLSILALTVATGCPSNDPCDRVGVTFSDPGSEIAMVLDLSADVGATEIGPRFRFFNQPWPFDLRLGADGKAAVASYPLYDGPGLFRDIARAEVMQIKLAAAEHMEGWPTATQVYLLTTDAVDRSALPAETVDYRSDAAPIQLVDIDPDSPEHGRRFPLEVGVNVDEEIYRPANLLQVLPQQGFQLREDTTYAVIATTDVPGVGGKTLKPTRELCGLLAGEAPEAPLGEDAVEVYAPLAAFLDDEDIDHTSIGAATVFTTGAPTERMIDVAAWFAEQDPPAPSAPLTKTEEFDDYCVYSGTWTVPGVQLGEKPYLERDTGGVIQFDGDGDPIVQYTREAPFVVTVPKAPMPPTGYPLLFYIHGTGGESTQVYARGRVNELGLREPGGGPAKIAANRGWGASGMGGHLATEDQGDLSLGGFVPYNFFNLQAMRDNFIQMTGEHILFRRVLDTLTWDVSDCPGADTSAGPGGLAAFDPAFHVVHGQSLGSYLAGLVAANDPEPWQGAILTGAGGSWSEFALGPTVPFTLDEVLELVLAMPDGEELDLWHPIIQLATLTIEGANNIPHLYNILREPLNGREAPHVFVIEGHIDLQVTVRLQRALVAALGVDFAGEDVFEIPPGVPIGEDGRIVQTVLLAGGEQLDYPVAGNFEVPAQGAKTAVVVRYPEDGIQEGHNVVFQREEPKHQIGCFLEDIAAGRTPQIIEGTAENGPCP